jgi:thioester reductase-like protein
LGIPLLLKEGKMLTDTLDLQAEVVLDTAIEFTNPLSENWNAPKSIFLTGATGFLGAYLLDELLHKTTADIYCLVRCNDAEAGIQRLKKHLEFYFLWKEDFSSRIIPVVGDLSQPLLGLSQQQFSDLASQLHVIYHNGALVNSVYPYSKLKATNVLGTQEILRLASLTQTKPVHFVSSKAVFFSQTYSQVDKITETDVPVLDSGLKGGYKQSKWVAEQLVAIAQERGLPACIYRASRIMGHSQTGITGNFKDFLCSLLKACIQIGKFPTLETQINLVPVDYLSQAIVHLSRQENSLGKAFHLSNPQPISWKNLFEEIRSLGYLIEETAYDEWLVDLKHHAFQHRRENALYSLLPLLLSAANALRFKKPRFDEQHTSEGLAGTSIVCPPVDTELLSTYFSYFQKSGYLPSPPNPFH